jgi:hypothetical protein
VSAVLTSNPSADLSGVTRREKCRPCVDPLPLAACPTSNSAPASTSGSRSGARFDEPHLVLNFDPDHLGLDMLQLRLGI